MKIGINISIVLLLSFVQGFSAGDVKKGETLFKANCASCHNKNMKSDMTGPALAGVEGRWDSQANLYAWIKNSQAMVKKGHPRAVEVFNKFNKSVMTAFPSLTDDDLASLITYINAVSEGTYPPKATTGPVVETAKKDNKWFYPALIAFLAFLSYLLSRVLSNLNKIQAAKAGSVYFEKTLWQKLTSKGFVSFLIFAAVLFAGYTSVTRSVNFGRQQGYEPDQPIKFSHATHAGENKIDCQYCHDGARRSKQSIIPATNTCMNCHKAIKVGSKYGTAELTKIYASIGFNPNTNTYIENYESMPSDSLKAIFGKWIGDQYIVANNAASLDEVGKLAVDKQWNNIVSSLTGPNDTKVQGPIEWTRIHNLPDHVYFNHSQHVNVGKISCQTCHGAIEKMDVVAQSAPLSMGWCINCHRQTEVKFADNDYYKTYARFHEEIKSGKRDKVTVEDIGGLECQKCHY